MTELSPGNSALLCKRQFLGDCFGELLLRLHPGLLLAAAPRGLAGQGLLRNYESILTGAGDSSVPQRRHRAGRFSREWSLPIGWGPMILNGWAPVLWVLARSGYQNPDSHMQTDLLLQPNTSGSTPRTSRVCYRTTEGSGENISGTLAAIMICLEIRCTYSEHEKCPVDSYCGLSPPHEGISDGTLRKQGSGNGL